MSFLYRLILAAFILLCPVSTGRALAEQIHIQRGDSHGLGTVINHNGGCVVLSVLHVMDPRNGGYSWFEIGQKSPGRANLQVLDVPLGVQGNVAARLGQLTGWTRECRLSLTWVRDDAWTYILYELAKDTTVSGDLFIRLIDGSSISDVPIRLQGSPFADTFDFTLDASRKGRVPDRAGISGSGIYYDGPIAEMRGRLVGIVNGASTMPEAYTALRIEPIVRFLGLAVNALPDVQDQTRTTAVAADRSAEPVPKFATECDREAANPGDAARHPAVQGRPRDEIDLQKALAACILATAKYPGSPRLIYQLGRALAIDYLGSGDPARFVPAIDTLNEALSLGHARAIANLEELLVRDSPDCGGIDGCLARYEEALATVARIDPIEAAIMQGRLRVYGGFADRLCPEGTDCVADLVLAYDAVPPGPDWTDAQAQIAYLVLYRGHQRDCGTQDAGCRASMQRAFAAKAVEGASWAAKALGDLYAANQAVPGGCDTRQDCRVAAVAAWTEAAALGQTGAMTLLGDNAFEPGWFAAFGCADRAACHKVSYTHYVSAAAKGDTAARGAVVWFLLYDQASAGCGDTTACLRQARISLAEPDFAATALGKSRLAEAIEDHPDAFADLCSGDACLKAAFDLYLASAGLNSRYAMLQVGYSFRDDQRRVAQDPPGVAITGCTDHGDCLEQSLQWFRKAAVMGQTDALYNWLSAVTDRLRQSDGAAEDEIAFRLELRAWIDLIETRGGARDAFADQQFLDLMLQPDSGENLLCQGFVARCTALRDTILSHVAATEDAAYVRDVGSFTDCRKVCPPWVIDVMGRAAAAGATKIFDNPGFLDHLDARICPFARPACPEADKLAMGDFIRQTDLADLADLESALDQGGLTDRMSSALSEIMADKGSVVAQTLRDVTWLVGSYRDGGMVEGLAADRVRAAAASFITRLQRGGDGISARKAALHLMFVASNPAFGTVPEEVRADLGVLFLMLNRRSEAENWDIWQRNEGDAVIRAVQRKLGVADDGDFGNGSWQAAETLAADYARSGYPALTSPLVVAEPADAGALQRLAAVDPARMLTRISAVMVPGQ